MVEDLREYLENTDYVTLNKGITIIKEKGLSKENVGRTMLHYMFHDSNKLRQAVSNILMEQGSSELKEVVGKKWIEQYKSGKGLGKNNLAKLVKVIMPLIDLGGDEDCADLFLSYISDEDFFRELTSNTNQLIAQMLNSMGQVYLEEDKIYEGHRDPSLFVGKLGNNIVNLSNFSIEQRKILASNNLGDKLEYFDLMIICMNSHCGIPYFYGEVDFYKPKNTSRNDYIHEHGFGYDYREGIYCEDCLGNDLSGGVFNKISKLSKGKKRPPRIPKNLKMSSSKEGREVLKNALYPIGIIAKSGKNKCTYSEKIIPKNALQIEFNEDVYVLPEYAKEYHAKRTHSVKPIFNDEGECVEIGEHDEKDRNILYKVLLAALKLGRPSTKDELKKEANLTSAISEPHMSMLLQNNSLNTVDTSEKLPAFFSFIDEEKMYMNDAWCVASQILNSNNGKLSEEKFGKLKKVLQL